MMLLTIDHNLNTSNLGLSTEHLNWLLSRFPLRLGWTPALMSQQFPPDIAGADLPKGIQSVTSGHQQNAFRMPRP
jgi:hypothetical protein